MAFLTGLLGRARAAFDPSRLALSQALLAGDYDAAAQVTRRLRRRRAEHERLRTAPPRRGASPRAADAPEADEMAFAPRFGFELEAPTAPDRQAPHALPPGFGEGEPFRDQGPHPADRAREPQHFLGPAAGMDMEPGAASPSSPWDRRLDEPGSAAPFGNPDIDEFGFESPRGMVLPVFAHSGFQQGGRSAPRSGESRPPVGRGHAGGRARVGVGVSGQRESIVDTIVGQINDAAQRAHQSALPREPTGELSARRESRGGGPGTISSGLNDPGLQSYGTWQLRLSSVPGFIASPFARPWAAELRDVRPGTDAFNAAWRRIAERAPAAFQNAQHKYLWQTHYKPVADQVRRRTGLGFTQMPQALREVGWSASIQHGPEAVTIFENAIGEADRRYGRDHPAYMEFLIRQVYAERIELARRLSARYSGSPGRAQTFRNLAEEEFPEEMNLALQMYRRERGRR